MTTDSFSGEVAGTRYFNWAIIVGAAVLLLASVTNDAPRQPATQTATAPIETVVVSAAAHRAS